MAEAELTVDAASNSIHQLYMKGARIACLKLRADECAWIVQLLKSCPIVPQYQRRFR